MAWIRQIVVLDVVDSTNEEVRRRAAEAAQGGLVVVAERQTAGRGRQGRVWHSAPGLGLYVSSSLRAGGPLAEVTRYTLAAAVAGCEACREACGATVTIQWPNDLTWAGRKLGGILCELRAGAAASRDLVVGAGFNVLHGDRDFPPELALRATSLALASGASMLDREQLLVAYLGRLGQIVERMHAGDWHDVARRWLALAPQATGAPVRLLARGAAGIVHGTTAGIDDAGALLVRATDGRLTRVRDVDSVRFEGE